MNRDVPGGAPLAVVALVALAAGLAGAGCGQAGTGHKGGGAAGDGEREAARPATERGAGAPAARVAEQPAVGAVTWLKGSTHVHTVHSGDR